MLCAEHWNAVPLWWMAAESMLLQVVGSSGIPLSKST